MLFDIGWPELMLIGIVALVVIGPKDLPRALRVAGFWVRKARTLSREFQSSVDQMIREAELEEVREDLKKAATRRRAAMLVPIIALLAPVMLLFILAPIPRIVFGLH